MNCTYDKIFFLHIPKTAGSAFNGLFTPWIDEQRYFAHMESRPDMLNTIEQQEEPFFLSGHFPFHRVSSLISRPDVFSITILRRPVDQLLSHLKWVKHVGSPKYPSPDTVVPSILELARQLYETPFSNVNEITRLVESAAGRRLFDNLHVRYLTSTPVDEVGEDDLLSAIGNTRKFDFVFAHEDMEDALSVLRHRIPRLGQLETVNIAPITEPVDLSDSALTRVLQAMTTYDRLLYDTVRSYSVENYLRP